MNITLLGHRDIASLFALDRLIALLPKHRFTAFLSTGPAPSSTSESLLDQLTYADAGLCSRLLAGELGGPVAAELTDRHASTLENPNSPNGLRMLTVTDPDLVVSIRYRRILHDDAVGIPRLGVLNLHSGLLPDYRGVMATFWAMLNREKEIGTTLHWIVDAGIDTGPVVGVRRQAVRPQRSYLANVLGLYADGCEMLAAAITSLAAGGPLPDEPQTLAGQYYQAPDDAAVGRFENGDMILFDRGEAADIRALRQGK